MNKALQVYKDTLHDYIDADFTIETLDSSLQFTEGPVWSPEGFYLFSDIPANCIYKIVPGQPKEIYISESGTHQPDDPDLKPDQVGSNALAFDAKNRLLVCRHGAHELAVYSNKKLEPLAGSFNDKRLNSPNDLIVHSSGYIYFSDPPYGLKEGKLNPDKFQPLAAVYKYDAGKLKLVCDKYQYPNGVCLSPDESILYICSNKPFERFVSMYDTATDTYQGIFAEENSDGIECDRHGNIYLCNKDGIIILDSKGNKLALISLPAIPANCCWGGPSGNDLFITARNYILLIRNLRK